MKNIEPNPISRGALRVADTLKRGATLFKRGITATVGVGRDTYTRTAQKIKATDSKIKTENKKQENLKTKTDEKARRNAREKSIEKKNTGNFIKPVTNIVKRAVVNPLKALLNLFAAWAIKNLPQIIKSVRVFIKKLEVLYGLTAKAIGKVGGLIYSVGQLTKAWLKNIQELDFEDSKGRIEAAERELSANFEDIKAGVAEFGNVWSREEKDLDKMLSKLQESSGESIRQIISDAEKSVEPQQTMVGPDARSTSTTGSKLFDIIASGEGDYNSINRGNAGDTPGGAQSVFGKDLTEMTVNEVVSAQKSGKVFAVGRYQIIPTTMEEFVKNTDVKSSDKFDEKTQDKFKEYVINVKRPEVGRYLRGESDDRTAAAQGLAREFASVGAAKAETIPGFQPAKRGDTLYGGKGNNLASIDPAEIEKALDAEKAALSSPKTEKPKAQKPQSAKPPSSGTIQSSGATTMTKSMKIGDNVSGFKVSSSYGPRWGSTHKGIDVATPIGTYLAFSIPVEVLYVTSQSGYGKLIDVWAPSVGLQFRIAHLSTQLVKPGQKVAAGVPVARTGNTGKSTGPHLHFEVDTKKGSATYGGAADPALLAKGISYVILSSNPPRSSTSKMKNQASVPAQSGSLLATAASNRTNINAGRSSTTVMLQKEYIMVG